MLSTVSIFNYDFMKSNLDFEVQCYALILIKSYIQIN